MLEIIEQVCYYNLIDLKLPLKIPSFVYSM